MLGVAVAALPGIDHQYAAARPRQLHRGRQARVTAPNDNRVELIFWMIGVHGFLPCVLNTGR